MYTQTCQLWTWRHFWTCLFVCDLFVSTSHASAETCTRREREISDGFFNLVRLSVSHARVTCQCWHVDTWPGRKEESGWIPLAQVFVQCVGGKEKKTQKCKGWQQHTFNGWLVPFMFLEGASREMSIVNCMLQTRIYSSYYCEDHLLLFGGKLRQKTYKKRSWEFRWFIQK
jgi:hypothetical protein